MDRNDREGRDAAGVGPYARERERLTPLSSLDWSVSDGEPDIRGWEVRTISGRQLGAIADLLVDADAGEVVMLDVDLPGSDRHTYVPIRVAQIDRTRRLVLMDSADLPDNHMSRVDSTRTAGRRAVDRATDAGTVRYPRTDREVVADRATLADAAPFSGASSINDDAAVERRRAERRRIDRISTDF